MWEYAIYTDAELEVMLTKTTDTATAWMLMNELGRRSEQIRQFHEKATEESLRGLQKHMAEHVYSFRLWRLHDTPHWTEETRLLPFTPRFEAQLEPFAGGMLQSFLPVPPEISIRAAEGVYHLMFAQHEQTVFLCRVYLLEWHKTISITIERIYSFFKLDAPVEIGIVFGDGRTTAFSFDDNLAIKNPTFVALDSVDYKQIQGTVVRYAIRTEQTLSEGTYIVIYELEKEE